MTGSKYQKTLIYNNRMYLRDKKVANNKLVMLMKNKSVNQSIKKMAKND